MPARARFHRWLPALLLMGAIAFLSHQSDPVATLAPLIRITRLGRAVVRMPDYAAHFAEYFCLTLAVGYALLNGRERPAQIMLIALPLVAVFALSDELHQAFIPRRTPDTRDLLADMLGAISALGLLQLGRLVSHWLAMWVRSTHKPI